MNEVNHLGAKGQMVEAELENRPERTVSGLQAFDSKATGAAGLGSTSELGEPILAQSLHRTLVLCRLT